MSHEPTQDMQSRRPLAWTHPVNLFMVLALMTLFDFIVQLGFARFSWFQGFQDQHGFWAQLLFAWASLPILFLFRRKHRLTDQIRFRDDLRRGRLDRRAGADE
jgi:hypothetical protein